MSSISFVNNTIKLTQASQNACQNASALDSVLEDSKEETESIIVLLFVKKESGMSDIMETSYRVSSLMNLKTS